MNHLMRRGAAAVLVALCAAWTGPAQEVPQSGLKLWLKVDTLEALKDGAGVAVWPDSGPNGIDATQPVAERRPLVVADAINRRRAVRFDGDDDLLRLEKMPLRDLKQFELFLIVKTPPQDTRARPVVTASEGNRAFTVTCRSATAFQVADRDNQNHTLGAEAPCKTDQPFLVDIIHDAPNQRCRARTHLTAAFRTATATDYQKDTAFGGVVEFGALENSTDLFLAEALLYDHELTPAERLRVEDYAANKYGLKVTPPAAR